MTRQSSSQTVRSTRPFSRSKASPDQSFSRDVQDDAQGTTRITLVITIFLLGTASESQVTCFPDSACILSAAAAHNRCLIRLFTSLPLSFGCVIEKDQAIAPI